MVDKVTFRKVAAQGELLITKMKGKPKASGKTVDPVNGLLIVGHSETGHHHVVDADCATLTRVDEFLAYLTVIKPTELVHQRGFDTHRSVALQPGMYEFRTGREFDPFDEVILASSD